MVRDVKVIILAAGKGSRMGEETRDIPKCMLLYRGKRLIDYTLDVLKECEITEIVIVSGYKSDVLEEYLQEYDIKFIRNENFEKTNMVHTMFCADSEMLGDTIVCYSDIIFSVEVFRQLVVCEDEIAVVVDQKWRELWTLRMDNPLDDAETMKIDSDGYIRELGKKPLTYDDINGQYIGLFKISMTMINQVRSLYESANRSILYDGKNFNSMYMTSFIQLMIDRGMPVKAMPIERGWLEFDTVQDLNSYSNLKTSPM